jgi:zinc/manganese transport system substrate-binding protein
MRTLFLLPLCCLALAVPAGAKLNVVATTADLGAIATEIGGDRIDLTVLAKPAEDPHFVDAKPSYILKLNRADVVIEGGAELEIGWLPALLDQARNPKLAAGAPGHVAAAQGLALRDVPAVLDRSKGDIHAAGNPHYLVDPANAVHAARRMAESFTALDPAGRAAYEANLQKFSASIDARMKGWQAQLEPFHGRHVVAYHDSWPYFAARFGLTIDLFLEPKPGIPPSPAHQAEVIARMKADKIGVIIVDAYVNRRTAETVARATGATVVDVTQYPGGVKGSEGGYVALIDYLVKSLATALAGAK